MYSSTQMFASIQQVSNDLAATAVLAPALANAALLVAAPSLGCLRTYNSVLTDLYNANGLPMPDLAPVFNTVNFQFYKEFYTTTTLPSPMVSNCLGSAAANMNNLDFIDFELNPVHTIGPELSNDTPDDQDDKSTLPPKEVSTSVCESSICESSVCDSPSVDVDSFLLKAFTPLRQTTDLAETIMRLPYPSEEGNSSPTIAVDLSLLQASTPTPTTGLSETPLRVSGQIKSRRSFRRMVTPTNACNLPETPLRVSSQIKSLDQDIRSISRRLVTPKPTTVLPATPVRVLSLTKSLEQDLPPSSMVMVTPANTSDVSETPVSLTKSTDQDLPPSSMVMDIPENTSDVSETPASLTKSSMVMVTPAITSDVSETPESLTKSTDQDLPPSSMVMVTPADTSDVTETSVRIVSLTKSSKLDKPKSSKRIVTSLRNKPNQGLKRSRSTTRTKNTIAHSNIHQEPELTSFTCPGCNNTFRKDHGLQKHLGVNPMCKAIHNSLDGSSQTGRENFFSNLFPR